MMTAFGLPMWICLLWLFVLGSVVGSFLNVCVWRFPQHDGTLDALRSVIAPSSRCPRCRHLIPPVFNIPIFGWLMLRGRCYHCRGWISMRYPIIECLNGLLWVLLYWMEIPGEWRMTFADSCASGPLGPLPDAGSWLSPVMLLHVRYFYHLILLEALLVASLIDIDLRIIPDASTLPAMFLGVLGAGCFGKLWLTPLWHQNQRMARDLKFVLPDWIDPFLMSETLPQWFAQWPHLHALAVSLGGLLLAGGGSWAIRILGHWALGRETLGFGDVILMALMGSFLGWQASVMIFFIAPGMALAIVLATWLFRKQRELPYGPYLSLAALFVILFWKPLWIRMEPVFGSGPLVPLIAVTMLLMFAITLRLTRVVFEFFGLASYDDEPLGEWTSGDHLFHYGSESVDPHFGRWPGHQWPGSDSSRGWTQYAAWKQGGSGSSQWPGGNR